MSTAPGSPTEAATDELPSNWAWVPIESLAVDRAGALTDGPFGPNLKTSHYTESGPRVIRLQNIGDGVFHDEKAHIAREHFERLQKHEAVAQDVVVAMLGEKLPRACLVPDYLGPAIVKADCARLRVEPKLALPGFVAAGLNSQSLRRQADELIHGVGRPRLGLRWLKTLQFPLAPLPEQQRIVGAIESCFTRLDNAAATLERVQRNLKRYRASVLKAAVEGRLVPTEAELARAEGRDYEPASVLLERFLADRRRRWQENGDQRRYPEPITADTSALPKLPEGWCWARLDSVADVILGQQRSPASAGAEVTVPYIRAANITWAGLDLSNVKRMGFVNPDRHRLDIGDVLLSEASGSPMEAGKPVVWRGELPDACFQNTVLRVRAIDKVRLLPEFLRLVFLRDCVAGQFAKLAPGVGIVHIGAERLSQWPVPLASLPEQWRIVSEVARVESFLESLAQSAVAGERRCVRLRQAILKWAFEGKLADQDPADEPASVLLKRIRAERDGAAPTRATTCLRAGRPAARTGVGR